LRESFSLVGIAKRSVQRMASITGLLDIAGHDHRAVVAALCDARVEKSIQRAPLSL